MGKVHPRKLLFIYAPLPGEPVSEVEERTSSFLGRDTLPGFGVFRLPHLAGDARRRGIKETLKRYIPTLAGDFPNTPIPANTIPSSVMEKDDSVRALFSA